MLKQCMVFVKLVLRFGIQGVFPGIDSTGRPTVNMLPDPGELETRTHPP